MLSLKDLCISKFFLTLLERYAQYDLALRDTLVQLPTSLLEYYFQNVFDLIDYRDIMRVLDVSFILLEIVHQRNYKRETCSAETVQVIKTCSFLTSEQIISEFYTLDVEEIQSYKKAFRRHCWVTILNKILRVKRLGNKNKESAHSS